MLTLILAGGKGTRLWPYSRTMAPKQFLNLGKSKQSLLQGTIERHAGLSPKEKTYIVGGADHALEIQYQTEELIADFPEDNILLEPKSCNTAPAILWALSQIPESLWDESVVVVPADHLIEKTEDFLNYLKQGETLSQQGKIVIFGIKPDRPETGYGYIKAGHALDIGHQVERFEEKPSLEKAKEFIQKPEYSWNAGIFMGTPRTFLNEFKEHAAHMYNAFFDNDLPKKELLEKGAIDKIYNQIVADSFDYAIMEQSNNTAVISIEVGWSDLGSWESIYQVSEKDDNGNVSKGNVILQDTKNSLVFSDRSLITAIGLENIAIIETNDALLACDLTKTQSVKQLVDTLIQQNRSEYEYHSTVRRPWGSYTVIYEGPGYKIKKISVLPGKRLSLQRHFHRSEHWVVVKGTAKITNGEMVCFMSENESTYIPKTAIHRLENPGKTPLDIIEVQEGDYLEEDDIQRMNDDFGRDA